MLVLCYHCDRHLSLDGYRFYTYLFYICILSIYIL
jgi:hypothetical protein